MKNKTRSAKTLYVILSAFLFFALNIDSIAQIESIANSENDKIAKDPNKGLPKSGLLSSTYNSGYQAKSIDVWSRKGESVEKSEPLSGSVSRGSDSQWKVKIFNNSEDSFDANIRVRQINSKGSVIKTDSFSFRLKPKGASERSVFALSSSADAQMELVSWKRIGSTRIKEEESNELAIKTEIAPQITQDKDIIEILEPKTKVLEK